MSLSRQLVASTPNRNFCRFCGNGSLGCQLLDLQRNKINYTTTVSRLQYMNIKPTKRLTMNICKSCFDSLNNAYRFCQNYNRTQLRFAYLDESDEENAEKPKSGQVKRVLDNIKIEHESADDVDIEELNEIFPGSNKKKKIVDLDKSWSSYTWTCCHCDAEYKELDALRAHSKKKHLVCFGFECPDCDIKLNIYARFIEHVRNHKENLKYYCDICDKPIEENRKHDHTSVQAMCRYCGEILPDAAKWMLHQRMFKKRRVMESYQKEQYCYIITVPDLQYGDVYPDCDVFQSWNNYVWICSVCDIKFHSAQALRYHAEAVHDECFTMKCMDCNETTESFHKLILHIMRHRPSLRHFCPYCNHLAHSDELFREHIKHHLTNSSYCPECGQIYRNKISKRSHEDATSIYWFLETSDRNASTEKLVETTKTTENVEKATEENKDNDNDNDNDNGNDAKKKEEGVGKEKEKEEEQKKSEEEGACASGKVKDQSKNVGGDKFSDYKDNRLPIPKTCRYCEETFTDKRLYRQHTNIACCAVCDKSFRCVEMRDYHVFAYHMADKPYECYKCGRCHQGKRRAYQCMESHLAAETKMCKICRSMVLESYLNEHMAAHKYSERVVKECGFGYCTKKFNSWMERVNHRHSRHIDMSPRQIHSCRRFLAQRNILGTLPMTERLPIEFSYCNIKY